MLTEKTFYRTALDKPFAKNWTLLSPTLNCICLARGASQCVCGGFCHLMPSCPCTSLLYPLGSPSTFNTKLLWCSSCLAKSSASSSVLLSCMAATKEPPGISFATRLRKYCMKYMMSMGSTPRWRRILKSSMITRVSDLFGNDSKESFTQRKRCFSAPCDAESNWTGLSSDLGPSKDSPTTLIPSRKTRFPACCELAKLTPSLLPTEL